MPDPVGRGSAASRPDALVYDHSIAPRFAYWTRIHVGSAMDAGSRPFGWFVARSRTSYHGQTRAHPAGAVRMETSHSQA